MSIKEFQPQCSQCKRRGQLDGGLCAICFYNKHKIWSKKFICKLDRLGNSMGLRPMRFRKAKK